MSNDTSYLQWMRFNRYDLVTPLRDNPNFITFWTSGQQQNMQRFNSELSKGDILICTKNSDSSGGFLGHAAIATTDN